MSCMGFQSPGRKSAWLLIDHGCAKEDKHRCLQIQDAFEYTAEVLKSHPTIPAFIGGQSLGGLISASVALRNQSVWSGLVLCSAAIDIEWTLALR